MKKISILKVKMLKIKKIVFFHFHFKSKVKTYPHNKFQKIDFPCKSREAGGRTKKYLFLISGGQYKREGVGTIFLSILSG